MIGLLIFLVCLVTPALAGPTINCEEGGCTYDTISNLPTTRNATIIIPWHNLQQINHPFLKEIPNVWLSKGPNSNSILSIGLLLRKTPKIKNLNLMNVHYNRIIVPRAGPNRYVRKSLHKIVGIKVHSLSVDYMKWLGGLKHVELFTTTMIQPSFSQLANVHFLRLEIQDKVSVGHMFLGNNCKVKHLELVMPNMVDISTTALSSCNSLVTFKLTAPKLQLLKKMLIPYTRNLDNISLEIKGFAQQVSLSDVIIKQDSHKRQPTYNYPVSTVYLKCTDNLNVNIIGNKILLNNFIVRTPSSCQLTTLNSGQNVIIKKLDTVGTPVILLPSSIGFPTLVESFVMAEICESSLYFLENYQLDLTKDITIQNGNLTDISQVTNRRCDELTMIKITHNKVQNSVLQFTRHPKLRQINLSHNSLTFLQLSVTGQNFSSLNLSHNAITDLFISITASKSYSIDLSHNKLRDLQFMTMLTDNVYFINLKNNNLVDITDLAKIAIHQPISINIYNNSFACNCANKKALIWAKLQRHHVIRETCWPPSNYTCVPTTEQSILHSIIEKLNDKKNKTTSWNIFDDINTN